VRATARRTLALVVVILFVAAGLRSYRLAEVPPGVEHDEVAEWQIARGILSGHHALFFSEAYGQEPLYLYLQAVSIFFLGDQVFALRFTSFAVAMLTMAACFRMTRRLFGSLGAVVSLALMAVALWPMFFARVAIRGMMLPLVLCLAVDAALSGLKSPISKLQPQASQPANQQFAVAGIGFGLSGYTYLAARAVPFLLVGFSAYLALFARGQMRGKWSGWVMMLAIVALMASPLAVYLVRQPDIQFRVGEVSGPLDQLLKGDPSAVLGGVRDTALMFSVRGDQTVRDNWPFRPVFVEPLSAALFYLGCGLALWRWRKPEVAFVLMWLVTLLVPTMVTAAPPNFVRALGALPPIFALPGLGATELISVLSRQSDRFSLAPRLGVLVFLAVVVLNLFLTARDYFIRWPAHAETQFVWQTDLASVADYLDAASDVPRNVSIAGLSNETMDDSSLRLLLKRRDLDVRWFDSRTTLILPAGQGRMFIPHIVPLDPLLGMQLAAWGAQEQTSPGGHFSWYELPASRTSGLGTTAFTPAHASIHLPAGLDNAMVLLAFSTFDPDVRPGGAVTILSYWQARTLPLPPLKAFVHLADVRGQVYAQSDGLNAPPQFWRPDDVIVQLHRLTLPIEAAGAYRLELGLYNAQTGLRAQFLGPAGQPLGDYLVLTGVEVMP
jgi:4-amino-4-deoxy-L-arabinose transferase-like glycosyltransferase